MLVSKVTNCDLRKWLREGQELEVTDCDLKLERCDLKICGRMRRDPNRWFLPRNDPEFDSASRTNLRSQYVTSRSEMRKSRPCEGVRVTDRNYLRSQFVFLENIRTHRRFS